MRESRAQKVITASGNLRMLALITSADTDAICSDGVTSDPGRSFLFYVKVTELNDSQLTELTRRRCGHRCDAVMTQPNLRDVQIFQGSYCQTYFDRGGEAGRIANSKAGTDNNTI